MKLNQILGILIIVLSPLTAIGMYVSNMIFWDTLDVIVIIAAPAIGFLVIYKLQSKK